MSLIKEKVDQAIEVLKEQETDLWLTFVRETSGVRDPALDLLIGPNDLTWQSALILTRRGEKIAIVGNLERESLHRLNVYDTVVGYDTAMRELLRETISRLDPQRSPSILRGTTSMRMGSLMPCMRSCETTSAGLPMQTVWSAQSR